MCFATMRSTRLSGGRPRPFTLVRRACSVDHHALILPEGQLDPHSVAARGRQVEWVGQRSVGWSTSPRVTCISTARKKGVPRVAPGRRGGLQFGGGPCWRGTQAFGEVGVGQFARGGQNRAIL
jgi:hypothetical protein